MKKKKREDRASPTSALTPVCGSHHILVVQSDGEPNQTRQIASE